MVISSQSDAHNYNAVKSGGSAIFIKGIQPDMILDLWQKSVLHMIWRAREKCIVPMQTDLILNIFATGSLCSFSKLTNSFTRRNF